MLNDTKPDIVWSFVPNNRHLEIVQACASRKVHVIVEQRLVSTYKDALAIRDLANKRHLCNDDLSDGLVGFELHCLNWLTDSEKNGGGALLDFGCYNGLWSLWYYKNETGTFKGSWDLPRSYQDLEVFGLHGSVDMQNRKSKCGKPDLRRRTKSPSRTSLLTAPSPSPTW